MNIALGNDHAAWEEKFAVLERLKNAGHTVNNLGADTSESTDYPERAAAVAHCVAAGEAELGIIICGSGIGVSIAANKINGIRAALCHSPQTAQLSRKHNNANILCLGGRVLPLDVLLETVDTFLSTDFEGGRHARRVDGIHSLE